jgi:hypothetical protein
LAAFLRFSSFLGIPIGAADTLQAQATRVIFIPILTVELH